MNDRLTLISVTYDVDNIGQQIEKETSNEVFCEKKSITSQEWANAGVKGLQPQYKFIVPQLDYNGEELVEYKGKRYAVYRRYEPDDGTVELYVEKKAGV